MNGWMDVEVTRQPHLSRPARPTDRPTTNAIHTSLPKKKQKPNAHPPKGHHHARAVLGARRDAGAEGGGPRPQARRQDLPRACCTLPCPALPCSSCVRTRQPHTLARFNNKTHTTNQQLEHIASPKGTLMRRVQDFIGPVWEVCVYAYMYVCVCVGAKPCRVMLWLKWDGGGDGDT